MERQELKCFRQGCLRPRGHPGEHVGEHGTLPPVAEVNLGTTEDAAVEVAEPVRPTEDMQDVEQMETPAEDEATSTTENLLGTF